MCDNKSALSPEELVANAATIWRKSQILHQTPPRGVPPEAWIIVIELAGHPECEESLYRLLHDPCQLVAAHSLMTLEKMKSKKLASLPSSILTNRSSITLMAGSLRISMDLGGLARQVQKRATDES